ncbi:SGNH/GDSL hydrolase family protein [Nocardia uniformis]|uniref:SGNH/GDSL hydrolase family protein n=1 Tax=Nocardia uniformis TaxID=53432 RepID=A0A849C2H3_9NOCA|nr:SGNH/GDSL hydrolase family protein [Nocardia uniformis]NNH69189.1 SGNH/GDSL hydrolase family protein [Nocardia uniformis]
MFEEAARRTGAWRGKKYVALGSSFAAGPGIVPRVPGSPRRAGRSRGNYPHLVAAAAGLELTDATCSGATCAHVLRESLFGLPPQLTAVAPDADLVTVTIGGNDVSLTPYLLARRVPAPLRLLPVVARAANAEAALRQLGGVEGRMVEVLEAVQARAPWARVMVVNYLSVLGPGSDRDSAVDRNYRTLAEGLAAHTAAAAERTGAGLIDVRTPSLEHAPGTPDAWTIDYYLPIPGRRYPGSPCHPTAAGMAASAALVLDRLITVPPVR